MIYTQGRVNIIEGFRMHSQGSIKPVTGCLTIMDCSPALGMRQQSRNLGQPSFRNGSHFVVDSDKLVSNT